MIEEAIESGGGKFRFNSLLILGATIVILLLFAVFGSQSPSAVTGSIITGASTGPIETEMVETDTQILNVAANIDEQAKYDLILNILKLKHIDPDHEKLQFAEKVSNIAIYVESLESPEASKQWEKIVKCFQDKCDISYYPFMETVLETAFAKDTTEPGFIKGLFSDDSRYYFMPELLQYILNLHVYIEQNDIIETSKTMIAVNEFINKIDSTEIAATWDDLVNCDLKCPLYDKLLLQLVEFKLNHIDE